MTSAQWDFARCTIPQGISFSVKSAASRVIFVADRNLRTLMDLKYKRKYQAENGQNGMKNIIYLSGSDKFPRIKIGIGHKPNPDYDLAAWVLSKFSKDELKALENVHKNCLEAVGLILDGKPDRAMNLFN